MIKEPLIESELTAAVVSSSSHHLRRYHHGRFQTIDPGCLECAVVAVIKAMMELMEKNHIV